MALARKKRPLVRERGDFRDASLFVVATEGKRSEPLYLGCFQGRRIKVVALECQNGRSSPQGVLETILEYKRRYQIGASDRLWIVVDRDAWRERMFSQVFAECRRQQVSLLVSNPFFEIWLALHFDEPLPQSLTRRSIEQHLRRLLGSYSKKNYPVDRLVPRLRTAIARSKQLDTGLNEIWPDPPGSRLYCLFELVIDRM